LCLFVNKIKELPVTICINSDRVTIF